MNNVEALDRAIIATVIHYTTTGDENTLLAVLDYLFAQRRHEMYMMSIDKEKEAQE